MVQNEINRYYALTNTQSVHNTLKVTLSSFYLVSPLVTTMYSIINKWRNIKLALGINAWPGTAIKFRDKTTSGSVPCEYSCHGMKKKCSFLVEAYKAVHNVATHLPLVYEIRELLW